MSVALSAANSLGFTVPREQRDAIRPMSRRPDNVFLRQSKEPFNRSSETLSCLSVSSS